jgi:hypothetical protein
MEDTLEDRLAAVERALTDDDHDFSALVADGDTAERVHTLETELDDLRERVEELEAATQALRGYVGNVRAVNNEVRERADRALELAERAETRPPTSETAADTERDKGGTATATTADEPTLELADNEPADPSQTAGSHTDGCPLCDGGGRNQPETPAEDQSRQSGSRTEHAGYGRTDGGIVDTDETSDSGDATVLSRIRALL